MSQGVAAPKFVMMLVLLSEPDGACNLIWRTAMQLKVENKKLSKKELQQLEVNCTKLFGLHKEVKYLIKTANGIENRLLAYIVTSDPAFTAQRIEDEVKRKEAFAKAFDLAKKEVARARKTEDQTVRYKDVMFITDHSLEPYYARIKADKEQMEEIAEQLPGHDEYTRYKGFSSGGYASWIAETISSQATMGPRNYPKFGHMRKRMGLAPYQGEEDINAQAYATWKSGKPRSLSAEEWIQGGYSGKRRSTTYAITQLGLTKQKNKVGEKPTDGSKDTRPTIATGYYGEVYFRRVRMTLQSHPEWTPTHRRNDAERYVAQQINDDIWRSWNDGLTWYVLNKKTGHGYWN